MDNFEEKDTFGFAVIGCGLISRFHIGAIREIDDAFLAGVYDQNPEAAVSMTGGTVKSAQKQGIPRLAACL